VAGGIDQVDLVIHPADGRGRGGDGDAALALELHVVHGGAVTAALDLSNPVDAARVVQNPLRQGGFARVDVGGDPDVADHVQRCVRHTFRRPSLKVFPGGT
jgi:hypothetical protein